MDRLMEINGSDCLTFNPERAPEILKNQVYLLQTMGKLKSTPTKITNKNTFILRNVLLVYKYIQKCLVTQNQM